VNTSLPRSSGASPADPLRTALTAVELELMRQPSIAKLRADRRAALARDVLDALDTAGFITGIPALTPAAAAAAA
jgi:hypothetical protein